MNGIILFVVMSAFILACVAAVVWVVVTLLSIEGSGGTPAAGTPQFGGCK